MRQSMKDFRATYSRMTEDELVHCLYQFDDLVEEAKEALRVEFAARGKDFQKELQTAEAQKPLLAAQALAERKHAAQVADRRHAWAMFLSGDPFAFIRPRVLAYLLRFVKRRILKRK